MNYLEKVQHGVDYIEANLDSHFELSDVSNAACMSQWHFQRIFKALTNETLKAYIRSRRIANSLEPLLRSDKNILDIAISAGFESHESFTRAFQKMFDLSPNDYRKRAKSSLILRKPQFDIRYLENLMSNISLEPTIYTTEERKFVGMQTNIIGYESEKNNIADKLGPLWNEFIPHADSINHKVLGTYYGVISQTEKGQLSYMACIEVKEISNIPNNMVAMTLPSQQYAEFEHTGLVDVNSLNNTVNYIYSSWLLRSNMRHTFAPDIEIYGPDFKMNSSDSLIYYAIPVE